MIRSAIASWSRHLLKTPLTILCIGTLAGCAGDGPRHPLRTVEERLETDTRLNWSFHRIVEDPTGLGLRFPGYIIGIEKSDRSPEVLGVDKEPPLVGVHLEPEAWKSEGRQSEQMQDNIEERKDDLEGILNDGKRTFISHVVSYDVHEEALPHVSSHFIHNVYSLSENQEDYKEVWEDPAPDELGRLQFRPYDRDHTIYNNSWLALDKLRRDIAQKLASTPEEPVTHVFLFSMGWNTAQDEALRNYNSLFGNLLDQAAENGSRNFRPLFIGLTWPSEWTYPLISYFNKADDADEIGFTWANYLINRILLPLKQQHGFKLVVVGHSFGARLVSRAVFSGPVLGLEPKEKVDLLVSLSGAFSMNRFIAEREDGREGAPYASYANRVEKIVVTWSRFDTANPMANWVTGANNAGGEPGYERALDYPAHFQTETWDKNSSWLGCGACAGSKILMVDASDLVQYSTYGKGGHAHSDIYSPQMGLFLWKLVDQFASVPPPQIVAAAPR